MFFAMFLRFCDVFRDVFSDVFSDVFFSDVFCDVFVSEKRACYFPKISQIFTFELKKQKRQYRYAVHGKEDVFTEAEFLF